MKLPIKISTAFNKLLTPMSTFYGAHESTILTATTIGCSAASTTLALKNSRAILENIDVAKYRISTCETKEQATEVYKETFKALIPLLGPVVALQALSWFAVLRLKSSTDKKIAGLTEALATANNAIAAYQLFKDEAQKVIPAETMEQIESNVAKKQIEENPQTSENTVQSTVNANNVYRYYDVTNRRYFYSCLSPTAIRERIHNLSIQFTKGEINNYDDQGKSKVTHNDIWHLIDDNLKTEPGRVYGWIDESLKKYRGDEIIEDAIDVDIEAAEDPEDSNQMVWWFHLNGRPLFRTRL